MTTSAIGSAIDVGSIVSQLMAVERQPLTALQKSISGIQTKLSAFGKVQGQLSTFQDAAKELFALDTWRSAQATSSDETAAKATASTGAIPGSYDLTVTQLAQRQTLSTGALASGDVVVGGGTMRVQLGTYASVGNTFTANPDKPEVSITIAAGSTLSQVRDAINSADPGVSASLVNDGTGVRLVIRSEQTGLSNVARISVTDDDGNSTDTTGLSSLSHDPTLAAGAGKNLTETQAAQNALLSVSGIAVSSPTNQVEGLIENVTLDVRKAGTGTINIGVAYDGAAMRKSVEKFVSAWNDLNKTLTDQTKYDATSKAAGPLQGNNTVLGMQRQLRATLQAATSGTGIARLSDAGLEVQRDGSLTIKSSKFDALLTTPSKLKTLFGASSTTDPNAVGIARRLDSLVTGILGSEGAVTSATTALRTRQTSVQAQQTRFESRMTQIEARLIKQYTALDKNMAGLNTTSSYLSSQFG
ncbi:MAG: flagellar filament capping protein FliD [Burkholderiaceae bacterium]|nr:flagellar filament capping protein FliD [Burkholderiaceae bacterium]